MADESHEAAAAAIVSTAHLLLRGLIPAFIGCSIGSSGSGGGGTKTSSTNDDTGEDSKEQVRASAFQMTYRKDMIKFGTDGKLLLLVLFILHALFVFGLAVLPVAKQPVSCALRAYALCSLAVYFLCVIITKKYIIPHHPSLSLLFLGVGWLTQGDTRVKSVGI